MAMLKITILAVSLLASMLAGAVVWVAVLKWAISQLLAVSLEGLGL